MHILVFVLLAAVSASGLAYVALQPRIAAEKKKAARLGQYARMATSGAAKQATRDRAAETLKRRRSIQTSLKDIDDRQKERTRHVTRPSLKRRIEQSGLALTERQFVVYSVAAGFVAAVLFSLLSSSLLIILGAGIFGGLGLPRFLIDGLRKRRQKRFIEEFPNAIDLVVRGIRSGLPVNDTFRMIAAEAVEPVRSEFRRIVEGLQLGIPVGEAVERLYQSIPLPETNFFSIVINIQTQAGGNLAEALGNLSRVLRERKKMKAKIQAMSMEAKASAAIIGSLPVVVGGLLYVTTPAYIGVLFTHPTGQMIVIGGLLWMSIGVLIMRQMINFDF